MAACKSYDSRMVPANSPITLFMPPLLSCHRLSRIHSSDVNGPMRSASEFAYARAYQVVKWRQRPGTPRRPNLHVILATVTPALFVRPHGLCPRAAASVRADRLSAAPDTSAVCRRHPATPCQPAASGARCAAPFFATCRATCAQSGAGWLPDLPLPVRRGDCPRVQPEPLLAWSSPVAFETDIDPAGHQSQYHVHRHARRTPMRREPDQEPDEQPDDEVHEGEHSPPLASIDQEHDDRV